MRTQTQSKRLLFIIANSAICVLLLLPGLTLQPLAQEKAAEASRPTAVAVRGTAKIDGEVEDAWKNAPEVEIKKIVKSETSLEEGKVATAKAKLLWDKEYLYALISVKDSKLSATASEEWAQDSVELFVDELNQRAGSYQPDDAQYRVSYEGKISGGGPEYNSENIKASAKKTDSGYVIEMAIRLSHAKLQEGTKMGLELQVNDDPGTGSRGGVTKWNHPENDSYQNTSDFGVVVLKEKAE